MIREINLIVVHCSATHPHLDIGAKEIRQWHTEKGWSDIGYHYVITRNGNLDLGRPLESAGAHVKGYNDNSIGICLVGGVNDAMEPSANFTLNQYVALERLIIDLKAQFPFATICGHRDLDKGKACPSFDVNQLLSDVV